MISVAFLTFFETTLTPHPIAEKAFIQREIGGVSVMLTVTPTLPQTLTPTLHPRYSGHLGERKRIRFDALQAIVPSICQAVAPCISVCLQVS